ncbi:hypothetical protein Q3O60_17205 [Alkalimonas collagenimarina]|uniref:Uncharacterized protein n=1 Tax=Alkalimonas collagenimarina TaxID=400390 RepID=A0ABT9H3X4_9GAMM|nr:hypothetical protein [Alkalimonas collagenimarina]MDP4537923.1 hypothetical protein [Alkalimonas collagenimarina]
MKKIFFFLIISLPSTVDADVSINSHGNIEYSGSITEAKNDVVFALYDNAPIKPKRLIISSPGGVVEYGIQLGEWIINNLLDVEVGDYCMSSCANYVFLAGNNKILSKHSLLGWHGGLLQRLELPFTDRTYLKDISRLTQQCDLERFKEKYRGKLAFPFGRFHKRECLLMQSTGIDYRIMVFGQYEKHRINAYQMGFWSYELDALAALGVTNIILKEGTWQPPRSINKAVVLFINAEDIRTMNTFRSHGSLLYFIPK